MTHFSLWCSVAEFDAHFADPEGIVRPSKWIVLLSVLYVQYQHCSVRRSDIIIGSLYWSVQHQDPSAHSLA